MLCLSPSAGQLNDDVYLRLNFTFEFGAGLHGCHLCHHAGKVHVLLQTL